MKVIGISHHDGSPNYFLKNFVEVWQSLQTHNFFLIQRGVPRVELMGLNTIASFLLW
jgi:hypothetical protein